MCHLIYSVYCSKTSPKDESRSICSLTSYPEHQQTKAPKPYAVGIFSRISRGPRRPLQCVCACVCFSMCMYGGSGEGKDWQESILHSAKHWDLTCCICLLSLHMWEHQALINCLSRWTWAWGEWVILPLKGCLQLPASGVASRWSTDAFWMETTQTWGCYFWYIILKSSQISQIYTCQW